MVAWKLSSLQFLKSTSKVGRGGGCSSISFLSPFSPGYNHLKDDSNRNQRIHEGDFKEGFQININYSA